MKNNKMIDNKMIKNNLSGKIQRTKNISVFFIAAIMILFTMLSIASANVLGDTANPVILSVSPMNNEKSLSINEPIKVVFNQDMNASTINADTFIVMQRTTPENGAYRSMEVNGTVSYITYGTITYNNRTATFQQNYSLTPNQQYGNVFTVMITTGATNTEGTPLLQDYVWSFSTGGDNFNTGNSTSQQNQSFAEAIVPVVIPPVVQPVITTPETNQTNETNAPATIASPFPWNWIIGGALAIIIIAIAVSLMMAPKTVKSKKTVRASRPNPFGDVYPVLDIEGVGTKYNKGLNAIGIKNTKQLWEADAAKVARSIGAPISSVKSWQNMAELASVKDIGPQYAELLERSGVHSIDQLGNYNANDLLSIVRAKENSLKINIQGNTPGPALVENWIEEARDHQYTESESLTA